MDYTPQQFDDVYAKLRQVAAARDVIRYQELSNDVGLGMDMGLSNDRRRIGVLLGAICVAEHAAGRPMLSAVVVHANEHPFNPGPGFFVCARDMVRRLPLGSPEQPFFERELAAVHQYWADFALWQQAAAGKPPEAFKPYGPSQAFVRGDLVHHPKFGNGVVHQPLDANKVEIVFSDGRRTMAQKAT